ncbi:TPA: hypothetical protein JHK52_004063 [Citrobacter koseri]|uniref:hypothetical protein n=1 Tax=Citrobacter farmeri TaxID=67824 RepID=UPI0029705547|nr:hypothetical protein [Citrobacter koseri]
MSERKTFFERYQPVFEIVSRILGNGWRVNLLDDCQYRIKLTSPQFKNYSIHIRMESNRLSIVGSVDSRSWRSPGYSCTVSPIRNPVEIAADIERKILVNALQDVEKAQEYERNLKAEQEQKQILKGMLSQLVQLESWYGTLTGFRVNNGLNGNITEHGDGYDLLIRGLSIDQLVKLTGMVKKL